MAKRALIYCDRPSAVSEMAALAGALRADGRFDLSLFLGKDLDPASRAEFGLIDSHLAPLERSGSLAKLARLAVQEGLPRLTALLPKRPAAYVDAMIKLKLFATAAEQVIERTQPDLVVISDDRIMRYNLGLILAARARRLPIALVPFAVSDPVWEAATRLKRGTVVDPVVKDYMAANVWTFPDGRQTMFYAAGQAKALCDAGLRFVTPWQVGGGDVDVICVGSAAHRDSLVAAGIPVSRVRLTGRPSADSFFAEAGGRAQVRAAFCQRHGLEPTRKLIVLNAPPYADVGLMDRRAGVAHVRAICQALVPYRDQAVVSLHPRMSRETYGWITSDYGLRIADEPIRGYLCAVDVMVSYLSSVNHWAASLHIPVILLNELGHPDANYSTLPGVVAARPDTLATALDQAVHQPVDYSTFEHLLGPFDGGCCTRIAETLYGLV